jgi:tRNA 2-thiouridine synthesizing protein E
MDVLRGRSRSYTLDRRGFLADSSDWDPEFCSAMASRIGMLRELTLLQMKVVLFVRRWYVQHGEIARLHETCRGCGLSLAGLRALFPCGYQRGVCRLAGIPYRVIDSGHHALTYETIARRVGPDPHRSPSGLPRASGDDDR